MFCCSGSAFEGQWQNGKRHGLGVETRGRWLYRGEWTQGFKGRYGVRQSATSNAKYEGTWANGLQDGYGSETYADGGTYQGQWLRGMRHGYGVRASAPFGLASHYRPNKTLRASLTSLRSNEGGATAGAEAAAERDRRVDDSRGGFVLKARSDEPPVRRRSLVEKSSGIKKSILSGLKIRKQRSSTGDLEKRGTSGGSIRSTGSSASWVSTESSHSGVTSGSVHTDSNASFVVEDEHMDASVTETYMGEWKNDKRSGFGISERSDGLRYEGEWFGNKKYGYGVTTFRDGSKEEGKYKNNVLITSQKKKHLFLIRSAKFRERIDAAVNAAQRASKIALQKADIAISRTATARGKAELADMAADQAREDFEIARTTAKQFAPDFTQPSLDKLRSREIPKYRPPPEDTQPAKSILHQQKPPASSLTDSQVTSSPKNTAAPSNPNTTSQTQYESQAQYQAKPQSSYQTQQSLQSQQSTQSQYLSTQHYPNTSQQQSISQPQQYSNPPAQQQYQSQQQYQQQQFQPQNQPNPPSQMNYQPQSQSQYQSQLNQQSYLGQDKLPQAMVTPPTPLPEPHKMNPDSSDSSHPRNEIRRNSRQVQQGNEAPGYSFQQAMSDHFDHYKRPPSRDSSVDRYTRAASRLAGSRQPSVDKPVGPAATAEAPTMGDRTPRAPSLARSTTPLPRAPTPLAGNGAAVGAGQPAYVVPNTPASPQPPFEDVILRKRGLGQDIVPSPLGQPKRTESLYIAAARKEPPPPKTMPVNTTLQRKKSLPDVQVLPRAAEPMSREEASVLSSARREELRRMTEEAEKLRANPLLYLVSPNVKDWFSRQQLVMLVLFVNISLAIMFFKLLT
ncbi:junctophilin-1 isoform X1 [Homalodisca vitripennis]|uniref:junctophilin-1 isoform X1 n=1 Tax=Homalodisca vitripennis TaxID=197043 RepID=UPI001EEBBC01|nr:junctophilin-1 isoform X1 [Homalodisca vitripennis]